jgi:uncharacterized protein YbjT (DUF2867 family)
MSAIKTPSQTAEVRVAVAGANGLIGQALLRLLSVDTETALIYALLRRPAPPIDLLPRVQSLLVDYAALDGRIPPIDEAFCCLGTTIKTAGSQQAFRAVDFDAVQTFAQVARAAGARRFGVVSALGADAKSTLFYNRVKGEMEDAIAQVGFDSVTVARPSLLLGDRIALGQRQRLGERLATLLTQPLAGLIPRRVRPIRAHCVAQALLRATREARPGLRVVDSAELQDLGR